MQYVQSNTILLMYNLYFCVWWYISLKPVSFQYFSSLQVTGKEEHVPERIYKSLGPKMKFLVMLRDPVDRIDSDYNFNVSRNISANKICKNKITKEGNLV